MARPPYALWLCLACSVAQAAPLLVLFSQAQESVPLGVSAGPFALERQLPDGGLDAAGAPALNLVVSTSSPEGQLSAGASGPWSSTLTVALPAGGATSAPFYYRDGSPGAAVLSVPGGTDALGNTFGSAQAVVAVSTGGLADAFETGSAAPTWTSQYAGPDNTLSFIPAAAHRGSYGMRVQDLSARDAGDYAALHLDIPPRTGDWYLRAWVRVQAAAPADMNIISEGTASGALMDFNLFSPLDGGDPMIRLGGYVAPSGYVINPAAPLTVNIWHLVETALSGVGTSDGGIQVWLDGASIYGKDVRDWAGLQENGLYLGQPFENVNTGRDFIGYIDFDDVRVSAAPQASRLGLQGGPLYGSTCSPMQVELLEPMGSLAAAPYPVPVAVTFNTGDFVFSDPSCTSAVGTVTIPAGAASAAFYAMPSRPGTVTATATHPDFLPGQGSFEVLDGGTARGCGCRESGGMGAFAAAAVLVALAAAARRARLP